MDMLGVGSVICDDTQIIGIWLGNIFIWPDPWTDIWDEGHAVSREDGWGDKWSVSPAPPFIEGNKEMSNGRI